MITIFFAVVVLSNKKKDEENKNLDHESWSIDEPIDGIEHLIKKTHFMLKFVNSLD